MGLSVTDIDPNFNVDVWRHSFEDLRQQGAQKFETVHVTKNVEQLRAVLRGVVEQ